VSTTELLVASSPHVAVLQNFDKRSALLIVVVHLFRLENNVAATSLKVRSGKVQHLRAFHYGHEKDVRAQVVVRYDVLVRDLLSFTLFTIHVLKRRFNLNFCSFLYLVARVHFVCRIGNVLSSNSGVNIGLLLTTKIGEKR